MHARTDRGKGQARCSACFRSCLSFYEFYAFAVSSGIVVDVVAKHEDASLTGCLKCEIGCFLMLSKFELFTTQAQSFQAATDLLKWKRKG